VGGWPVAAVTAVDVGIAEDDDLKKYFEKTHTYIYVYIYICIYIYSIYIYMYMYIGFDFKRSSAQ